MIRKSIASSVIACAILVATVHGQNDAGTKPSASPAPSVGLKSAYAGKFLVGGACDPENFSEAELASIRADYAILTPGNSMKPGPIHPTEDRYSWTTPDTLVQWCQENHIKVWGHCLCWHSQTNNWFFQDANGQPASRELAMERLKKHIFTVVGHYKGRIMGWDVVNEAIADRGDWTTENLRNTPWLKAIGPDYLMLAFKWAHEADPNVELIYNDYNIEQGATRGTGKHASSLLLLKRLIKDGAPITGVGIQGHWHLDSNLPDIEKAITNYQALGLKVSITELDVTATGSNSGAMPTRGGGADTTDWTEAYQKQAQVYAQLFQICLRHADAVERVTFWGINDRRSWRASQRPLLFDPQMNPKPAYQAIVDVASGKYVVPRPSL
jgi:endo-1,4-beta-xylanase